MSDNQDQQQQQQQGQQQQQQSQQQPDIEKLVADRVAESLREIKSKLDSAYSVRDEALQKLAKIEEDRKKEQLERLTAEGKHKEALELQLAEERAAKEALRKQNTELTRDLQLKNALSNLPFRNDNAKEMAYREIVGNIVQDEKGVWVHNSGKPIDTFVKSFGEDDSNSFLFKPKSNSGAGGGSTKPADNSSSGSLFKLSQAEVLKLAAEGKLPSSQKRR